MPKTGARKKRERLKSEKKEKGEESMDMSDRPAPQAVQVIRDDGDLKVTYHTDKTNLQGPKKKVRRVSRKQKALNDKRLARALTVIEKEEEKQKKQEEVMEMKKTLLSIYE
eukprot:TRINITY_DN448_c0_g1_i1.p4 TRINITY_DN448_c0_g1~~TRINITY_DN448_c0_g1_i1.p4  ORF type:complete len:111 (-),score=34.98 TRINITY_DN448_c0_g1_i1:1557-1889(-)